MTSPELRSSLGSFDLDGFPQSLSGAVVAIGNFDGVHRGHAALLQSARSVAADSGIPAVLLTFEPHPRTVFRPDDPIFRLTPLAAKLRLLTALDFDGVAVVRFDHDFSRLSAEAFVRQVLVERMRSRAVVVGYDFHFGRDRSGNAAALAEAGTRFGFSVNVFDQVVNEGGVAISSSAIRGHLEAGEVAEANAQLGYRWFVLGEVIHGDKRGRDLGYPTANLGLPADCRLRHGIYAVRLQRADGTILEGVASYGRRPTFGEGAPLLEVFVFDFSGNLYGETVAVSFFDWIRPELAFSSVGELIAAMDADSARARAMLASAGPGTRLDGLVSAVLPGL